MGYSKKKKWWRKDVSGSLSGMFDEVCLFGTPMMLMVRRGRRVVSLQGLIPDYDFVVEIQKEDNRDNTDEIYFTKSIIQADEKSDRELRYGSIVLGPVDNDVPLDKEAGRDQAVSKTEVLRSVALGLLISAILILFILLFSRQ